MIKRKRGFVILAIFSSIITLILLFYYAWGLNEHQQFDLLLLALAAVFGVMCIVSIWLAFWISR
jgi:hypothetical protein